MEWVKAWERLPSQKGAYHCNLEGEKTTLWWDGNYLRNGTFTPSFDSIIWLDESASSPITSDKELVLKTRIEERNLCIYIIEQDLMDNKAYPLGYKTALQDEIENHKNYISDYEDELSALTTTTKEG